MSGAVPAPGRSGRLPLVVAATLALVVLALAGIAARSGSWAAAPPPATVTASTPPAAPTTTGAPAEETAAPTPDGDRSVPAAELTTEVVLVVMAVLSLGGLGLLLGAVHRPRLRRRGRSPATSAAAGGPGSAHEVLSSAVGRALHLVDDQPDSREAVVRAWLLLGRAATDAGTPARPAETAAEYVGRLAEQQRLPSAPLQRLAELYREARFSTHPVRPAQRDEARAALLTLEAALAAGRTAPAGTR